MEVAIIQLHGLVPVVDAGSRRKRISRGSGGVFLIPVGIYRQAEGLPGIVIEIVLRGPMHRLVVSSAEIHVLAGYMVGDEVDDQLETGLTDPVNQRAEFLHPGRRIIGQIGVHVIVVRDGVGRAGIPFHHFLGMLSPAGGMPDNAGTPDPVHSQRILQVMEGIRVNPGKVAVPPETGQQLINQLFHSNWASCSSRVWMRTRMASFILSTASWKLRSSSMFTIQLDSAVPCELG